MELTFLGTGAAEGYPAPYCLCENCQEARRRGGRSIRLRSSLLIDHDLLIDYSDVVAACAFYGVNLSRVETLLITHPHVDHLCAEQLFLRARPFARTAVTSLEIYAPRDGITLIEERAERSPEEAKYRTHAVSPGDRWVSGRFTIIAFRASHSTEDPLLYAINDGNRCVLYSTDTGRYEAETWQAIKRHTYDVVIIDETMGTIPTSDSSGHMGIDAVLEYRKAFEREGLLRPGAHFVAHHFSHGANPCNEEVVELLEPNGVEVAYDGWRLKI